MSDGENAGSIPEAKPTEAFVRNNDGMVHIRKRTLIIVGAVASTIVVLGLALGLGLGLGLPARDRANATAAAAASAAAAAAASNSINAATHGPAVTNFRAADSAYITTTVPLVEYINSFPFLLSTVPTSHSFLTITRLAAEATSSPPAKVQEVPQFFKTDSEVVFVTTATYTAVVPARTGNGPVEEDPAGELMPSYPHYPASTTGPSLVYPVAYGSVDCPSSNGTQYIDPGTGAVFTKLCYRFIREAEYNQLLKAAVPAVSLDECIKICASEALIDNSSPPLPCNAVSYDANITRSEGKSCHLIALRTQGYDVPGFNLESVFVGAGDWAVAAAVAQGFVPGYATFAKDYYLYPTEAKSCYYENDPCPFQTGRAATAHATDTGSASASGATSTSS